MQIKAKNMTNFFNRELFLYSLGDIQFKTPLSIKRILYTLVYFAIWSLPIILIFGFHLNVYFVALIATPPLLLGYYSTKPMFEGKTLTGYFQSIFKYLILQPKGWSDLKENNDISKIEDTYYSEHEIWISRRREIKMLKEQIEKENQKQTK